MNKPIYFLSDVHFFLVDNETERRKIAMISQLFDEIIENQGSLYIVGDFFDFWFEYKAVVPRQYFNILCKLHQLTESGCDVHYIGGNHDFWLYDFIKNDIGAKVYYDPLEITINEKFYIAHGDGLDANDKGYLFLKKILRNKIFIKFMALIPPGLAFKIARSVSGTSRKFDNNTAEILVHNRQKLQNFASEKFQSGFDYVILGHYHLPEEFHEGDKTYLNCGDWLQHFSYGLFVENRLKLKYYAHESQALKL